MALARIITRSEACSRELATDLISRGYTVEVVAPDAVPNHKVDLELRVEAKSGERLTAKVIVRDGERTASLDFDRDLTVPAIPLATANSPAEHAPTSSRQDLFPLSVRMDRRGETKLNGDGKCESDAGNQNTLFPMSGLNRWQSETEVPKGNLPIASGKIARPSINPPLARRPVTENSPPSRPTVDPALNQASLNHATVDQSAASRSVLIASALQETAQPRNILNQRMFSEPVLNRAVLKQRVVLKHSAVVDAWKLRSASARKFFAGVAGQPLSDHARSRFGIVAASLASLGLLLALAFSLKPSRQENASATQASISSVGSSNANHANTNLRDAKISAHPQPAVKSKKSAAESASTPKAPASVIASTQGSAMQADKSKFAVPNKRTKASTRDLRRHTDDLIARDTVTYLDRPAKSAKPKADDSAARVRTHRNGEIADNTVVYLNGMTPPSAAQAKSPK